MSLLTRIRINEGNIFHILRFLVYCMSEKRRLKLNTDLMLHKASSGAIVPADASISSTKRHPVTTRMEAKSSRDLLTYRRSSNTGLSGALPRSSGINNSKDASTGRHSQALDKLMTYREESPNLQFLRETQDHLRRRLAAGMIADRPTLALGPKLQEMEKQLPFVEKKSHLIGKTRLKLELTPKQHREDVQRLLLNYINNQRIDHLRQRPEFSQANEDKLVKALYKG